MSDYKVHKSQNIIENHTHFVRECHQVHTRFKKLFPDKDSTWGYGYYNIFAATSPSPIWYNLYKEVRDLVREFSQDDRPMWIQSWLNFHTSDQVLDWHGHDWPYHGYISIDPKSTRTIFKGVDKIQDIAYKHSETWLEDLQALCASCGVALVYTPCISKAPIYGATRWIKNNSVPLIQVTDRRKDYNAFWFTFFHELGHILYHGKKDIFIDGLESIKPDKEKEDQADEFAARMVLSEKERNELFQYPNFYEELVLQLSKKFKKHPSIIVSQIQRKYTHLYKNVSLNSLKIEVKFSELSI